MYYFALHWALAVPPSLSSGSSQNSSTKRVLGVRGQRVLTHGEIAARTLNPAMEAAARGAMRHTDPNWASYSDNLLFSCAPYYILEDCFARFRFTQWPKTFVA